MSELTQMINAIEAWLSKSDIEAGARWGTEIADRLSKAKVGIICITPSNMESLWMHFEAGALAKTVEDAFVCPYLTGVRPPDIKGPLSQFQAMQDDKEGTKGLVNTLNRALGDRARPTNALDEAFDLWWPQLKLALDSISNDVPAPKRRTAEDMIEELLDLTRRLVRRPYNLFRMPHPWELMGIEKAKELGWKIPSDVAHASAPDVFRLIDSEGKMVIEFPYAFEPLEQLIDQVRAERVADNTKRDGLNA